MVRKRKLGDISLSLEIQKQLVHAYRKQMEVIVELQKEVRRLRLAKKPQGEPKVVSR